MNQIQTQFLKKRVHLHMYKSFEDAISDEDIKSLDYEAVENGFSDDYFYNYYCKDGVFEKYFTEDKYIFCTMNQSLKIGSIYFKNARIRPAHRSLATYEILKRYKVLYPCEETGIENILKPININITADDKDNLICVFNCYYQSAYTLYQDSRWSYDSRYKNINELLINIKKTFDINLDKKNYQNCLYCLLCMCAVLAEKFNYHYYEEMRYMYEHPLGENGCIFSGFIDHYSRGVPLNLKFDMSKLQDFVSELVLNVDFLSPYLWQETNKEYAYFNEIADAYIDSITPDFIKNKLCYGQTKFNDELILKELASLCE